jgi:hypothetical protein
MPSAAKAGLGGVTYGTAEAVPFQEYRALPQTLKLLMDLYINI